MCTLLEQKVDNSTFWGIPYVLPSYDIPFYHILKVEFSTI